MKKIILSVAAIICIATLACTNASAVGTYSLSQGCIELCYKKIQNMTAALSIASAGNAKCVSEVYVQYGYNVRVTVDLKKKESTGWATVKTWVHSGSGYVGVNTSDSYKVSRGTYIVQLTAYVTDSNGNHIETQYCTSQWATY